MFKMVLFWILAIAITISAAIYQRKTGPTYPKRINVEVNGQQLELKLVRSLGLDERPEVKLAIKDTAVKARLFFRRYPTSDVFTEVHFQFKEYPVNSWIMNNLFKITKESGYYAQVDQQAAAGKVEYYFELTDDQGTKIYMKDNPVVIRFKGAVPSAVLIPHIFFMFFAMLLAVLSGILAIAKHKKFRIYTGITFILLLIGGMILGPLVQKYAFGDYWTGIPFGWDLTDNKTLIAFVFWLLAFLGNLKKERPWLTILATVILLAIYSIPHSMFGSELNYESGEVVQGFILFVFMGFRSLHKKL